MRFDPAKARANLQKHGVGFADAEQRFITLGMDSLGRLLVVVYALEAGDNRLISARKASPSEAKQYHA